MIQTNPFVLDIDNLLTPRTLVSLDLETTGLHPWEDKIDLIALKVGNLGFVLETDNYTKQELTSLFKKIASVDKCIMHNGKFDAGFIWYHYRVLLKNVHCTQVTAQICENGKQRLLKKLYPKKKQGPFALVSVLKRWINIEHKNAEDKQLMQESFIDKKLAPFYKTLKSVRTKQINYAYEDVEHLETLYRKQMSRIEELNLDIVYKLEHKLLPVLVEMEIRGCPVNKKEWKNLIENNWRPEFTEKQAILDLEVKRLLNGKPFKYSLERINSGSTQFGLFGNDKIIPDENLFNYGSQDHVFELFDALDLDKPTNEEGEPSLEDGFISVFITEHPDSPICNFLELLTDFRRIAKLVTTYGDKFLAKVDKDGNIHTSYSQIGAETGRLSSRSPNLQNIPAAPKNDPTKDIRRFFIAPKGYKFITCDLASAEVYIAADYSQEPLLLDSIRHGVDMHSKLASISFSIIFNKPVVISKADKPDDSIFGYTPSELRDVHKSVVFAKFYKGGAKRVYGVLSEYINKHCSPSERMDVAEKISTALDKEMPILSQYLSSLIVKSCKDMYIRGSSFNRIRFFVSKPYGEAANLPIQNTNAEAIKMAMINLNKALEGKDAYIVMNIHDELCVIAEEEIAEEVATLTKDIMATSLSYFLKTIKGKAEVKIENNWKK